MAAELAVLKPKVVRKVALAGLGKKEVGACVALEASAVAWQADRVQLVKQPVLKFDAGSFETDMEAIAGKVSEFFA